LLACDRVPHRAQVSQPLPDLTQLGFQVRPRGDRRRLALGGQLVEDLDQAGRARLPDPLQCFT
jgi:hypothetical protein